MIELELKSLTKKAAIAAIIPAALVMGFFVFKWGFAHSASYNADSLELADYIAGLSPNDPQTQFAAGVLADAEFDIASFASAEKRFETAVALSPYNYLLWLQLGKSREANGNIDQARIAFEQARALAPNYASVQWAYGNFLVRNGDPETGFSEIRKAVSADKNFADPAISLALQLYQQDRTALANAVGSSAEMNTALALMLVKNGMPDDAVRAWRSIDGSARTPDILTKGKDLAALLAAAHKYLAALEILSELNDQDLFKPAAGQIWNGGFEENLNPERPRLFDWQLDSGARPQIVLVDGQKTEGSRSLLFAFGNNGETAFRQLSQVVAVSPGKTYVLSYQYLSELKPSQQVRFNILDPADGTLIAGSDPLDTSIDWKIGTIKFTVPQNSDGIKLVLQRSSCTLADCRISGNLWLDSIKLASE